jgi:hypothetical protein
MKAKETGENVTDVATTINEDRIRILEELGFVWALRGNRDESTLNQHHPAPMHQPSVFDSNSEEPF